MFRTFNTNQELPLTLVSKTNINYGLRSRKNLFKSILGILFGALGLVFKVENGYLPVVGGWLGE
jgi:hypothetical protein